MLAATESLDVIVPVCEFLQDELNKRIAIENSNENVSLNADLDFICFGFMRFTFSGLN
jgi:hypothetical protein